MKMKNVLFRVSFLIIFMGWTSSGFANKIVGYVTYWSGTAADVPYSKLTHINYAFALPNSDGTLKPLENGQKLQEVVSSAHQNGVKVLISVGGWSDNGELLAPRFEILAANSQFRQNLINDMLQLVQTYDLDGVDIDWEYPYAGNSANNFQTLMTEIYNTFHPMNKLVTIAVAGGSASGGGIEGAVKNAVDWINIMGYDFNNFQHSTIAEATAGVSYYIAKGFPASQCVLGVPFYGRDSWESYSALVNRGANPQLDEYFGVGYNGLETITAKANYVISNNLGGMMIWEVSMDAAAPNSLLDRMYSTLNSANQLPIVAITAPSNNETFNSQDAILISASASDLDGTITRVDFYDNNTLIFSDIIAPFEFTMSNPTIGEHALQAAAYDNSGARTNSDIVNFLYIDNVVNQLPAVQIITPENNKTFRSPSIICINAAASDADGTVSRVLFYDNNVLAFTDSISPFSYKANNLGIAIPSLHHFTAVAIDNSGGESTSSMVTINIENAVPFEAQNVAIVSPRADSIYKTNKIINIETTTSDIHGEILKVEFYDNGTLIGFDTTFPFGFALSNASVGVHSLVAVAFDEEENVLRSSPVIFTVRSNINQRPFVSIISPIKNSTIEETDTIRIFANAFDNDGSIYKVEFYDGNVKLGEITSSPYTFLWLKAKVGSHTLRAKAIDNTGANSLSLQVKVIIKKVIKCSDAIVYVPATMYKKGDIVLFNDSLWKAKRRTRIVPSASNKTIWEIVGSCKSNTLPKCSIVSPRNNDIYFFPSTILLEVNATDVDGIIKNVQFFVDGNLLATDHDFPFSFNWDKAQVGTHHLVARCTDNLGGTASSGAISFNVVNSVNLKPTVRIVTPTDNSTHSSSARVRLIADAFDLDGVVTKVDFYLGKTLLVSDTVLPFEYTLPTLSAGNYIVSAVAMDDLGASSTSTEVSFTVTQSTCNLIPLWDSSVEYCAGMEVSHKGLLYRSNWCYANNAPDSNAFDQWQFIGECSGNNILPEVKIVSPNTFANNSSVGGEVNIIAIANDVDGSISSVEFYVDNLLVGVDSVSPYSAVAQNIAVGTHIIVAKAIDNSGDIKNSNEFVIIKNAEGCVGLPWESTAVYTYGETVMYLNKLYFANWWSQGNLPNGNVDPGQWTELNLCGAQNPNGNFRSVNYSNSNDEPQRGVVTAKESIDEVSIYPNPVENILNVEFLLSKDGNYSLQVFDMVGRSLYSERVDSSSNTIVRSLNLADYPNGIYKIVLSAENALIEKKFIVKH